MEPFSADEDGAMTTAKLRRRSTKSPARTLLIGVVGAGLAAMMTAVMMSTGMIEKLLAPHGGAAVAVLETDKSPAAVVPISTSLKVLGSTQEKHGTPAPDAFAALPTPAEPQTAVQDVAPAVPPLPAASPVPQAATLAPVPPSFSKEVSQPGAAELHLNRATAPEVPVAAPDPVSTVAKAPVPAAPEATDRLAADDADRMTKRAARLTESGDIAAARALLERPARAGFGPALYKLAETYDPRMLAQWGVRGIKGDPAKARDLYTKALQGGVVEARDRLGDIDRGVTPKTAVLGER
jgi:hypothetical protein